MDVTVMHEDRVFIADLVRAASFSLATARYALAGDAPLVDALEAIACELGGSLSVPRVVDDAGGLPPPN